MKTYTATPKTIQKKWYLIDANDLVLGRAASEIAKILKGKHKPTFTPHMDCGDNIIVINAEKVHLTGKKVQDMRYYKHTGFAGGIKETNPRKVLESKFPDRVIRKAVERMLAKESPLARKQLKNLHIYAGTQHPHEAQQPETLDLGARNSKNKRVR